MDNFKITLLNRNVPYEESSVFWPLLMDIHLSVGSTNETTLLDMCWKQDISPRYYKDLSQLEKDGLIKIERIS